MNVPYPGLRSPLWDDPTVMPPSGEYGKWRWSDYARMWVPLEGHWNFLAESQSWECFATNPEQSGDSPEDTPKPTDVPPIVVDDLCEDDLVEITRIPF